MRTQAADLSIKSEKTMGYLNSDAQKESDEARPIEDPRSGRLPERLRTAIGSSSLRSVADRAEVSEGTLRNILSGGAPKLDSVIRIADATGVSAGWLATGEGSMRPGEMAQAAEIAAPQLEDFALVTVYDVEASAGYGAEISDEQRLTQIAFRRDWLKGEGFNVDTLAALRTKGDSMEPTIPDGSLLLIDTSVRQVRDGAIYVLRFDGVLLAKRLQRLVDGAVRVTSDNRAYAEEVVDPDQISQLDIVGRVVWIGHRA